MAAARWPAPRPVDSLGGSNEARRRAGWRAVYAVCVRATARPDARRGAGRVARGADGHRRAGRRGDLRAGGPSTGAAGAAAMTDEATPRKLVMAIVTPNDGERLMQALVQIGSASCRERV